jgi:hypothetical protein
MDATAGAGLGPVDPPPLHAAATIRSTEIPTEPTSFRTLRGVPKETRSHISCLPVNAGPNRRHARRARLPGLDASNLGGAINTESHMRQLVIG